jgi:DNA-binding phage protein
MVHLRPPRRPHRCGCSDCLLHPRGATARAHRDINRLLATLDERRRRLFAAFLAREQGRGAIRRLARITGLSRNTIRRGLREWQRPTRISIHRIRRPGGGRKPVEKRG